MSDDEKRAMRKNFLALRRAIPPEEREKRSAAIEKKLLSLPEVVKRDSIFAYASTYDEVSTLGLISKLIRLQKRVFVPLITGKRQMDAVRVLSMDALVPDKYGILTVKGSLREMIAPEKIGCVIVPGVAFDRDGGRLGMGGGYYDAFLPKAVEAFRIAAAFDVQIAENIPKGPHDQGVDLIVTERGVFECAKR